MSDEWTRITREDFEPVEVGQVGYLIGTTTVSSVGGESSYRYRLSREQPCGLDGRHRTKGDLGTELGARSWVSGVVRVEQVKRFRVPHFPTYDELDDSNSFIEYHAVLRELSDDELRGVLDYNQNVIEP